MKHNITPLDRLLRMVIGNLLIFLVVFRAIAGEGAVYFFIAGVLLLLTSFLGFCPLYAVLNIGGVKNK